MTSLRKVAKVTIADFQLLGKMPVDSDLLKIMNRASYTTYGNFLSMFIEMWSVLTIALLGSISITCRTSFGVTWLIDNHVTLKEVQHVSHHQYK